MHLRKPFRFLTLFFVNYLLPDMSSTVFIEPLPVIDFVTQFLNGDVSTPLSDADADGVKALCMIAFVSSAGDKVC
ncbi:hypothetical protein J1N35_040054 [Gossypium stocksii]|uniref:Uncharacterized protein n=1 Tax=Gossypium stocksii TaxID=47602 RepID=A0A9D3UD45_9ROSI|nr:hypothetical protein J1N35_040054 [Gossypium stocksii]